MRWRTFVHPESGRIHPPAVPRAPLITAIGLALAAVALWGVVALGAVSGAQAVRSAAGDIRPVILATHLPPLLTVNDDQLNALRYDIDCAAPGFEESGCEIEGTVYVRPGQSGPFQPLALRVDTNAAQGRYVASLPGDVSGSATGFSYYAVVRDLRSGATATLPAGGVRAPQRSLRLTNPTIVDLGTHRFGAVRHASARVASAAWGDGPTDAGIEEGPQLEPIGASSFDVDAAGTVTVLDEAHKRLLRFAAGAASTPTPVPVNIRGTIADLALQRDGGTYILESVADPGETPLLRSFDAAGQPAGTWQAAEPSVGALRLGPSGPQALEYPDGQWMPVVTTKGREAVATQVAGGRPGRTVTGGREIVVQREGDEARIAIVDPSGETKSWRIHSATPLAEIQLAAPVGNDLITVLRTYTDTTAEFVVLVLGDRGVVRQFSIDPADWAETAPLSRFRLVGSSLFHLGSTRTGMFVDRFDLEAQR